jgi:hypothetical protein
MVGRSNVVRIDAGGGRGTGFLIRGGELVTALHVVAKVDEYEPVAFDVAEDWVVLRVESPQGVTSWEVEQARSESVGEDWDTYGFATEDGLGASGRLTMVDAPRSAIVD